MFLTFIEQHKSAQVLSRRLLWSAALTVGFLVVARLQSVVHRILELAQIAQLADQQLEDLHHDRDRDPLLRVDSLRSCADFRAGIFHLNQILDGDLHQALVLCRDTVVEDLAQSHD